MLSDELYGYVVRGPSGEPLCKSLCKPSWALLLPFEYEAMKRAYSLVNGGLCIKEALTPVRKDQGLYARHFLTVLPASAGLAAAHSVSYGVSQPPPHTPVPKMDFDTAFSDQAGRPMTGADDD